MSKRLTAETLDDAKVLHKLLEGKRIAGVTVRRFDGDLARVTLRLEDGLTVMFVPSGQDFPILDVFVSTWDRDA
jgi:hypothetical protein